MSRNARRFSWFSLGLLVALTSPAWAIVFNLFGPATGILKGNANSYQTTAAVSSDVIGLWTGTCNSGTFLRGDGSCAVSGGGSAGGSNTQMQYNSSGSLAGTTGLTWDGSKLTTPATATGSAGLNLPHGTAPTSPVNGDLWTTTAGLFARINGGTVGPFASGSGTPGGADTNVQYNATGAFAGDSGFIYNSTTHDVTSTGAFIAKRGAASATGFQFASDPNTGMWSNAADDLRLVAGGAALLSGTSSSVSLGSGGLPILIQDQLKLEINGSAGSPAIKFDGANAGIFNTVGNVVTLESAGTATLAVGASTLTYNTVDMVPTTGTFVVTFDDACTTSPTVTFSYWKIGKQITIQPTATSGFSCTGDSTNFAGTAADVPSALRPASVAVESAPMMGVALDNTSDAPAFLILINTTGTMQLLRCGTATASFSCLTNTWTASGTRSFVISSVRPNFTYYQN